MSNFMLIGIDVESSDKKVAESEITQIGLGFSLVVNNNNEAPLQLKGFETLVKCKQTICEQASIITGIKNSDLIDASCFLDCIAPLSDFIDEVCEPYGKIRRVLVAYNGKKFDIPLFVYELRRNGKDPVAFFRSWKIDYFFDPFVLCKNVLDTTLLQKNERGQPDYRLSCVYEAFFKKPLKDAHSALADTEAMLDLIVQNECLLSALKKAQLDNEQTDFLLDLLGIVQNVKKIKRKKRTSLATISLLSASMKKKSKKA